MLLFCLLCVSMCVRACECVIVNETNNNKIYTKSMINDQQHRWQRRRQQQNKICLSAFGMCNRFLGEETKKKSTIASNTIFIIINSFWISLTTVLFNASILCSSLIKRNKFYFLFLSFLKKDCVCFDFSFFLYCHHCRAIAVLTTALKLQLYIYMLHQCCFFYIKHYISLLCMQFNLSTSFDCVALKSFTKLIFIICFLLLRVLVRVCIK